MVPSSMTPLGIIFFILERTIMKEFKELDKRDVSEVEKSILERPYRTVE